MAIYIHSLKYKISYYEFILYVYKSFNIKSVDILMDVKFLLKTSNVGTCERLIVPAIHIHVNTNMCTCTYTCLQVYTGIFCD